MKFNYFIAIATIFLSGLIWIPASQAAERGAGLYRITCPPNYPGPEKQGAKLTYQRGWYEVGYQFGPPETVEVYRYPTTILIDCGYGYPAGQPKREDLTPYRVIVAVPGRARQCDGPNDGRSPFWCDTAPDEDGTIGPVKLHISERISLSTTLKGFGLAKSREEILVRAGALGLACTEQEEALLACVVQTGESVTVRFANGRSRVVEWRRFAGGQERYRQFYAGTILRFGTELWSSHGMARVPTWMEKGGKAKLEETSRDGDYCLTLTDLTVPAGRD